LLVVTRSRCLEQDTQNEEIIARVAVCDVDKARGGVLCAGVG
jgi:hypothetical protein